MSLSSRFLQYISITLICVLTSAHVSAEDLISGSFLQIKDFGISPNKGAHQIVGQVENAKKRCLQDIYVIVEWYDSYDQKRDLHIQTVCKRLPKNESHRFTIPVKKDHIKWKYKIRAKASICIQEKKPSAENNV